MDDTRLREAATELVNIIDEAPKVSVYGGDFVGALTRLRAALAAESVSPSSMVLPEQRELTPNERANLKSYYKKIFKKVEPPVSVPDLRLTAEQVKGVIEKHWFKSIGTFEKITADLNALLADSVHAKAPANGDATMEKNPLEGTGIKWIDRDGSVHVWPCESHKGMVIYAPGSEPRILSTVSSVNIPVGAAKANLSQAHADGEQIPPEGLSRTFEEVSITEAQCVYCLTCSKVLDDDGKIPLHSLKRYHEDEKHHGAHRCIYVALRAPLPLDPKGGRSER